MGNREIRISVCLACYNGERYISEQVSSILSQLGPQDELIISDDGSTDNTLSEVESIADSRIRIYENTGTHGVNGNFENALRHAEGEYIFLSDQDDVWLDGKVDGCLEALSRSCCVVHDAYITDGNLRTECTFFQTFNCHAGFVHNWIRNGYLGCAMAFRKDVLKEVLPIPRDLPVWHDIWIGSICALKYNVEFIPIKGILFRRHSDTTSITSKSSFTLTKKISYRIGVLWHLFKRIVLHT